MQVCFFGNVDKHYFADALDAASQLVSLPKDLEVYISDDKRSCTQVMRDFPPQLAQQFRQACSIGTVSFSFVYKKRMVIVLYLTKANTFLVADQQAFIGLFLHELMHIRQMQAGMYKSLQDSLQPVLKTSLAKVRRLHINYAPDVLYHIGQASLLLLKDLYANSALIQEGFGRYLRAYYAKEFRVHNACPRPVFYEKLKRAIKKDVRILDTVFTFEFSLLSVLLPFQRYEPRQAYHLIKHIEDCYGLNVKEVSRKCGDLVTFYLKEYKRPSRSFEKKYLTLIFAKLSALLQ